MKNLKKAVALLSAAVIATSLCACGKENKPKFTENTEPQFVTHDEGFANDYDDNQSFYDEGDDFYIEPETTVPLTVGYESENIKVYGESYNTKGQFAKFSKYSNLIAEDKNGRPYYVENGNYLFDEDEDVAEYVVANGSKGYKDSNGIYHFGDQVFKDVKGEIFYTFSSMMSGEFFVLSLDSDGTMLVSAFNKSGTLSEPEKYNNTPLYASTDYKEKFCKVDKIEVSDRGSFYIEADGKRYLYPFNGINYLMDVPGFHTQLLDESMDKVFDLNHEIGFGSPLYSKKNDTSAIYYKSNDEEFPVTLIDGYTVNDIKKAVLNEYVTILMNDGTVYHAPVVSNIIGTELAKHEEASALGTEGKLTDIFLNYERQIETLILVCDDNCLYELVK